MAEYKYSDIILVTGGAGCIGGNLCKKFADLGIGKIVILDDLSSAYRWNIPKIGNIDFVEGSVLDDETLKCVFRLKPDYIFHLAAHFANQNSVDNPEYDLMVNGMGTLKILQYAHITGVKRFVYASSGCGVYGLDSEIPFQEKSISINLHTPYQVTKLLGELYTNYFHNLYGLPIVNARFFNVFGPGEVPGKYRNVIPNFFYWALNKQALPITGNGAETRDWTYVDDIVNGLLLMGTEDQAIGQAFNLGSGKEHSVIEMANLINKITDNKAEVKYVERRDWDVKTRLLSSIVKANKMLRYNPETEFEDGLTKVHKWFIENWENITKCADF
ncbi:NAD-dependent epimerase/dehydratase family protein [Chloroflexota bacterium]